MKNKKQYLYKYIDELYKFSKRSKKYNIKIKLIKYPIIMISKYGVWINNDIDYTPCIIKSKKFVSFKTKNKFAYLTKEEAFEQYKKSLSIINEKEYYEELLDLSVLTN